MTSSWSDARLFLREAAAALLEPAIPVEIEALTRLWRWDEVRVICDRPAGLEEYPDLAVRVRGAMGRLLRDQAEAPRPIDCWGRPTAWETLYLSRRLINPAFVLKKELLLIPVFGSSR